ncbi:MAG TPA: acyl carrier protein [Thermodesulfobacteriota bacterium]|nr:acyl carrier protein [Thermodesulfobacteriota bacterium]
MQTVETLKRFIIGEIATELDLKDIAADQSLLETGILDSLGILKLVTFIEAQFLLKIDDEEMIPENFETLSGISKMISAKKASS